MKFFKSRKDQECKGACVYEGLIAYGDTMVIVWLNIGGHKIPYTFHPECYLEWHNQMFMLKREEFENEDRPMPRKKRVKKAMGRPRKYTNVNKAHAIRAKIRYHAKTGNVDKVQELEHELINLVRKTVC